MNSYEEIKEHILLGVSMTDRREGSFVNDMISPMAMELEKVYAAIEAAQDTMFVQTSTGIWLDKRGAEYNIKRKEGTKADGNYFHNHAVGASAHYFVDGNSVTQSVPDGAVAWAVGGRKYPNCAASGGGKWYGKCTNNNSISVELCDEVRNGRYDFSEATLRNAAELVRMLMKKYNVPVQNVIQHFDVTGKVCPKPFVEDWRAWQSFKNRLMETKKEMEEDMVKYYETLAEVPTWAKNMVQKQIDKGCYADVKKLHLSDDMLRTMAIVERENK